MVMGRLFAVVPLTPGVAVAASVRVVSDELDNCRRLGTGVS